MILMNYRHHVLVRVRVQTNIMLIDFRFSILEEPEKVVTRFNVRVIVLLNAIALHDHSHN